MNAARFAAFVERVFFVVILGFIVFWIGPEQEGTLFPVVTELEPMIVERDSDDTIRLMGEFSKMRDCRLVAVDFYVGKRGGRVYRASFEFDDGQLSARALPRGQHIRGPWLIGMTKHNFWNNSFADVIHDCHVLWHTRSRFWTGLGEEPAGGGR